MRSVSSEEEAEEEGHPSADVGADISASEAGASAAALLPGEDVLFWEPKLEKPATDVSGV